MTLGFKAYGFHALVRMMHRKVREVLQDPLAISLSFLHGLRNPKRPNYRNGGH